MHSLSAVVAFAYVFGVLTWTQIRIVLVLGFLIIAALEFDRLVLGNSMFDPLYRDYEEESPAGYAYSVGGMTVAALLFPPSAAVVGILLLSYADPIVGIIGTGELRFVKPWWALAAMLALSTAIAYGAGAAFPELLPRLVGPMPPIDVAAGEAVAAAVGATVADGVKYRVKGYVVDDNVTIPIYSAALMTAYGALVL
jgi:dolichol kinase